jgi:uncharacterized protein (TIGR03086 family)
MRLSPEPAVLAGSGPYRKEPTMDPVQLLSRVLANTATVVDGLEPAHLDRPTPCTEWTVRDTLNHLVVGLHYSAAVIDGTTPDADRSELPDVIGDDPRGAYERAAKAVVEAFSAPGALDRTCATPGGEMPGSMWINFPTFDVYVHGWDIARATGVDASFPEELTGPLLAFARSAFTEPDWPEQVLHRPVAVSGAAPAIDQLVAHLGRRPDWTAP